MKRISGWVAVALVSAILFSSCAAGKKDCQGVRHYKQKGGFYM